MNNHKLTNYNLCSLYVGINLIQLKDIVLLQYNQKKKVTLGLKEIRYDIQIINVLFHISRLYKLFSSILITITGSKCHVTM